MAKERRWLEIGADGIAFHERYLPDGVIPPAEVFYCDCNGVGRETWNPQNVPTDDGGQPLTLDAWKALHRACGYRRQIFVDVTARREVLLGMR